jgi:hypothetical protein
MNEVELFPLTKEEILNNFYHVFNNEFMKREFLSNVDIYFSYSSFSWVFDSVRITKGYYTRVETKNSNGEIEVVHFWKMVKRYKYEFCYSFQMLIPLSK